jgi:hypothetical protein
VDDGRTQAERDLESVAEFRNRLISYMNLVLSGGTGFSYFGPDEATARRLGEQRPWLTREYGRLFSVVNRWGGMSMGSPAAGITVYDVVSDSINNPGAISYHDIARLAEQHLDTVIGRLAGEAEEAERNARRAREQREAAAARKAEDRAAKVADPDRWYRITSPLYWFGRLVVLIRWIFGTWRGRILGAASLLVGAIIGGIVSGAAQAWFDRLLTGG